MLQVCAIFSIMLLTPKYKAKLKDQCVFYNGKAKALGEVATQRDRIGFPHYRSDHVTRRWFAEYFATIESFKERFTVFK